MARGRQRRPLECRNSLAAADRPWQAVAKAPSASRIAVPSIEPHRVYHVGLTGLEPGKKFGYRISQGSKVVFEAEGRAPRSADQKQRFVVFGDCGANTPEQKAIAYRAFVSKPHYVMITGDIVYGKGLISEYRTNFWPIYNADTASPSEGAPLLRSTLFLAAPGNHDIASRDLGKTPDGLAYFYYWFQPLNGPVAAEGKPARRPGRRPRRDQEGVPRGRRQGFPPDGELLARLRQRPLDRPRRQRDRRLDRPASFRTGSSRTSRPPRGPDGGSSASTSPASTRRKNTSVSSTCEFSPRSLKRARLISSSTATSTTINARIR